MGKVTTKLSNIMNNAGEWIIRLLQLQLLWFLCSALGLFVLGVFPSLAASYALIRKWRRGDKKFNVRKTFWKYYKSSFVQVNLLAYSLILIMFILWVDAQYFLAKSEPFMQVVGVLFYLALILVAVGFLMLGPLYSHYELSYKEHMKNAIYYPLSHFKETILIILLMVALWFIYDNLVGLLVFVGISLAALLIFLIMEKRLIEPKEKEPTIIDEKQEQAIYY